MSSQNTKTNISNKKHHNSNSFNLSDNLGNIKTIQQEDQYLLEQDIDAAQNQKQQEIQYYPIPNNTYPSNQQPKNDTISPALIDRLFQTDFSQFNSLSFSQPLPRNQQKFNQNTNGTNLEKMFQTLNNKNVQNLMNFKVDRKQPDKNSRISAFNQQLQGLLNSNGLNQKNSQVTNKEQKSKKVVSRLSQQFTTYSGSLEQNIKSKKKIRQTIGTFGLDTKKEQREKIDQKADIQKQPIQHQPEKMQLQTSGMQNQNAKNQVGSPQRKQHPDNVVERKPAQMRLSEARRNRQRVSMGMENLLNLMKSLDQEQKVQKKQPKPAANVNSRVTVDWGSLASFLQSKDQESEKVSVQSEKPSITLPNQLAGEQQHKEKELPIEPKVMEKSIPTLQSVKAILQIKEPVIFEDQKEDDITPSKPKHCAQPFSPDPSKCKSQLRRSKHKSVFIATMSKLVSASKPDYSRQLFNKLYCNLADKINAKKQRIFELKQKKIQITKSINDALSQFTITAQKLAEMKKEEHDFRAEIYASRQKVNKNQFQKNYQIINQFQLKLGIQLHRLQKYNKSDTLSTMKDGFFADFTYDDMMFRIKRNFKTGECYVKIYSRIVLRRAKKDFQFNFDERTELVTEFINKKLKSCKTFTSFMVHLIRYLKEFLKYEMTIGRFYCTTEMSEFQLTEKKNEMQFYISVAKTYDFLFTVDLMELTSNGGIKIRSLSEQKDVQIPTGLLTYQEDGNKLGMCVIQMEKYAAYMLTKVIENAVKIKDNVHL